MATPTPPNPPPAAQPSTLSSTAPQPGAAGPVPLLTHRRPSVDTGTRAINAAPIELDSTPVSPVVVAARRQASWGARGGGTGTAGAEGGAEEEDGEERGDGTRGAERRGDEKKRAALIDRRANDPAVLVDIPSTPAPEEYEAVVNGARDGAAARAGEGNAAASVAAVE